MKLTETEESIGRNFGQVRLSQRKSKEKEGNQQMAQHPIHEVVSQWGSDPDQGILLRLLIPEVKQKNEEPLFKY
jgi:hypothetical protein